MATTMDVTSPALQPIISQTEMVENMNGWRQNVFKINKYKWDKEQRANQYWEAYCRKLGIPVKFEKDVMKWKK